MSVSLAARLTLGAITAVALMLRLVWLWPPSMAVVQSPYDDEGVYVMAAQLLRQGYWPYRDFFFAHPPLGIVAILPAISIAYTPWGSSLSFGLARLLMVAFGSLTVLVIGLAGWRWWGPRGGLISALVLAVDPISVANSRHILLEVPMALLVSAALLSSAPTGQMARRSDGVLTGLLAGLAALVKLQAAGLGLALVVAALLHGQRRRALLTLIGLGLAGLLFALVAGLVGPELLWHQIVLFQLLRPADGLETAVERVAALMAPTGLLLGLLAALAGLVVWVADRGWARWSSDQRLALVGVALWLGLGGLSFLASRSYYQHYASQLMPGLALLAGGVGSLLPGAGGLTPSSPVRRRLLASLLIVPFGIVAGLGLGRVIGPRPDPIFVVVARYMADAIPAPQPALTTDAQFNYLASRPLPRTSDGFLVDSYGQMVYAGLGLTLPRGAIDGSSPLPAGTEADHAAVALAASPTVHQVMWRPAAQQLLRRQIEAADLVVIHAVGRGRVTPETVAWMLTKFRLTESNSRYDIYRRIP